MNLGAGPDGSGKSQQHRVSNAGPSSPQLVVILATLYGPAVCNPINFLVDKKLNHPCYKRNGDRK
jgi:hypothetical protein